MFGVCSDNVEDSDLFRQESDNECMEEAENEDEELWRRMRHEREMFRQQQVCTQTGSRTHISICIHPSETFVFYRNLLRTVKHC